MITMPKRLITIPKRMITMNRYPQFWNGKTIYGDVFADLVPPSRHPEQTHATRTTSAIKELERAIRWDTWTSIACIIRPHDDLVDFDATVPIGVAGGTR